MDFVNSYKLAEQIMKCILDDSDNEEYKEKLITKLYNELSQINSDNPIKMALIKLCEKIDELENMK